MMVEKKSMPPALVAELELMRRKPTDFVVVRADVTCSWCEGRENGSKVAIQIAHTKLGEAGTWCPVHGWKHFDSVKCPPTERLKLWEIEDNKQAAKRKADWANKHRAAR